MNLGQGQDWNDVVLSKRHTGAAASASKNVRAVRCRSPRLRLPDLFKVYGRLAALVRCKHFF